MAAIAGLAGRSFHSLRDPTHVGWWRTETDILGASSGCICDLHPLTWNHKWSS